MTEGSKAVLTFLQKHPNKEYTKREIVEQIDYPMSSVTGSVTNLVRKGYAAERIEVIKAPYNSLKDQEVRFVKITEAGLKYDPDEEARQKKEAQLQAAAIRREERRRMREEIAKLNSVK